MILTQRIGAAIPIEIRRDVTNGQRAEEIKDVVQGDIKLPIVSIGSINVPLYTLPFFTPVVSNDFGIQLNRICYGHLIWIIELLMFLFFICF